MIACLGCGNERAYQKHAIFDKAAGIIECCDRCGNLASSDINIPDVFWPGHGYYSQALDVEFTSRAQKARVMKEKNVTELGNQRLPEKTWTEGSRDYRKRQFEKDRPKIKETYRRYLNARRKP